MIGTKTFYYETITPRGIVRAVYIPDLIFIEDGLRGFNLVTKPMISKYPPKKLSEPDRVFHVGDAVTKINDAISRNQTGRLFSLAMMLLIDIMERYDEVEDFHISRGDEQWR